MIIDSQNYIKRHAKVPQATERLRYGSNLISTVRYAGVRAEFYLHLAVLFWEFASLYIPVSVLKQKLSEHAAMRTKTENLLYLDNRLSCAVASLARDTILIARVVDALAEIGMCGEQDVPPELQEEFTSLIETNVYPLNDTELESIAARIVQLHRVVLTELRSRLRAAVRQQLGPPSDENFKA